MSKNEIFDHEESERYEADNLKPFLEILRDKVNSKDTKVMAMFSQLIRISEAVVEYTDKLQTENCQFNEAYPDMVVSKDYEIDTLHERLGDHKVSDCCGDEIYCGNCHNEKLCRGKCQCENYTQNCLKCKKPCGHKFDDCDHKWVFNGMKSQELFIPRGEREKANLFDQSLIRERIDTKECMDEDRMTMMVQCEKCHHWKEINWTEYSLV